MLVQANAHVVGQLIGSMVTNWTSYWSEYKQVATQMGRDNVDFKVGFVISSLWYYVGVRDHISWDDFKTSICPNGDVPGADNPWLTWTDPFTCAHGWGHALLVRKIAAHKAAPMDGCSMMLLTEPAVMNDAFNECQATTAADKVHESWCWAGIFHGWFEHSNFALAGKSWFWPCDTVPLAAAQMCFRLLFLVIGQSYNRDPEWTDPDGMMWKLWNTRQRAFLASGGLSACNNLELPNDRVQSCISALSGITFFPADWGYRWMNQLYVDLVRQENRELPNSGDWEAVSSLKITCSAVALRTPNNASILTPQEAKSRWWTCVYGSTFYIFSDLLRIRSWQTWAMDACKGLMTADRHDDYAWLDAGARRESCKLCVHSASAGFLYSIPPAGPGSCGQQQGEDAKGAASCTQRRYDDWSGESGSSVDYWAAYLPSQSPVEFETDVTRRVCA